MHMHMNLDHVASGHSVHTCMGEMFFASLTIGQLQ